MFYCGRLFSQGLHHGVYFLDIFKKLNNFLKIILKFKIISKNDNFFAPKKTSYTEKSHFFMLFLQEKSQNNKTRPL